MASHVAGGCQRMVARLWSISTRASCAPATPPTPLRMAAAQWEHEMFGIETVFSFMSSSDLELDNSGPGSAPHAKSRPPGVVIPQSIPVKRGEVQPNPAWPGPKASVMFAHDRPPRARRSLVRPDSAGRRTCCVAAERPFRSWRGSAGISRPPGDTRREAFDTNRCSRANPENPRKSPRSI